MHSNMYSLIVTLMAIVVVSHGLAAGKTKTAGEWRKELDNEDKFGQMQHQEYKMLDETLGKVDVDSPALVYAHFSPDLKYTKPQLDVIASEWRGLLQSAGVRITVWGAAEGQVLVAAYRERDINDVFNFLLQQSNVMKVTHDRREEWNLPRFATQKQAADKIRTEKDMQRRTRALQKEEERKRQEAWEESKKAMEKEERQQGQEL